MLISIIIQYTYYHLQSIGVGTGGATNRLLGEQLVHPAAQIFFCNLQLKVTLRPVRLLLTQKFSKKFPSLSSNPIK